MRALVDTSVWSLAFRKRGPAAHPAVEKLNLLLSEGEDVFLCGVVLQEILQAFRSDSAFRRVEKLLEPFELLDVQRCDHIEAARLHRTCASSGVTAGTVDCLIAQLAIRHDCQLLTTDHDFEHMAPLCELKLA